MEHNYVTAANCSTSTMPTIEDLLKLGEEFKKRQRELLRGESLMIEQSECPVCKRKPTVTSGPFGKTYVVCRHMLQALKKHCQPAPKVAGFPHVGPPLHGVNIELYDDGPRRW